jgi:radical SAM superfamily enzyme YgiQ (UPF0313 family)
VGIETLEEKSLHECHKLVNERIDVITAVKKMQRFGLRVLGGFIVGFDNDPPHIFQEQVNFIQQSGIVTAMVGLLNPLRGTKLFKRLRQEGRLIKEWTGDNTDFSLNFIPKMGCQMLLEGYQYILNYIYSPCHFYQRLTTFLINYNPPKRRGNTFQLFYIKAFFHAIWTLGIMGEERFYYWKTLIWTILRRPRLFSLFVRLAIYGYHFRKVFEGGVKIINLLQTN